MSETTTAPLLAPLRMTELDAYAKLLKAGIDAPNPALVARLVAAAAKMQAGIARQPQDLPPGLEPAVGYAIPSA